VTYTRGGSNLVFTGPQDKAVRVEIAGQPFRVVLRELDLTPNRV
jgi:hypothetical protein